MMKITQLEELAGKGLVAVTDQRAFDHAFQNWAVGEDIAVVQKNGSRKVARILGVELPRGVTNPHLIMLLGGLRRGEVDVGDEIVKIEPNKGN